MEYINGVLEELEAIVYNASGVPMRKGRALVDREEVLLMLNELRSVLPAELSEAESVRRECSAMVAAAEEEAGRILEDARRRMEERVEHTDVCLRFQRRASEVVESAEHYARQISGGSEAYRERILGQLEGWCRDSLVSVKESRQELNSPPAHHTTPRPEPSKEAGEEPGWQANSA